MKKQARQEVVTSSFKLEKELYEKFSSLIEKKCVSKSKLIRSFILAWIKENENK